MTARTGTLFWLPVILDHADLDPTETLLMVSLAEHVDQADACFMGITTLASAARVSYGTARRRLRSLEERGYIVRSHRWRKDGGQSVYDYVLQRPAFDQGEDDPPAQSARTPRAPGRAHPPAHPDARAEPPREEPPHEQNARASLFDPIVESQQTARETGSIRGAVEFDRFWSTYPRRAGKGDARKAWAKAIRKAQPEVIVEAAGRYAADPNLPPMTYVPHPATWLNQERWNDDPLPRRNGDPPPAARQAQGMDTDRGGHEGLMVYSDGKLVPADDDGNPL